MIDYCNEVQGFINHAISNLKNINGDGIICPCKRCKKNKFQSKCCNDTFSTKNIHGGIHVLVCI